MYILKTRRVECNYCLQVVFLAISVTAFQLDTDRIGRSWMLNSKPNFGRRPTIYIPNVLSAAPDSSSESSREQSASSKTTTNVNGDPILNSNPSGALVSASTAKSQLFSAFVALDLPDQYDAVLTGLCAKILDRKDLPEAQVATTLNDPLQLLQEMNQKRILASPRSLMALIDATVKAQDAKAMSRVISLARRNGSLQRYGVSQPEITLLPSNPRAKIKCPDGKLKTRSERLADVADLPYDERGIEVRNALLAVAFAAGCALADIIHLDDITPFSDALLAGFLTVGVVDNFYDLLRFGINFASRQINKTNSPKKSDNDEIDTKTKKKDATPFQLPDKASLPFGLGTGQISGSIVRGIARLLTIDVERECQCEAAALFAAYTLGLPCFAFRPNSLEGSVLLIDTTNSKNELDSLDSSSGLLRMLIWLLAPVAMENSKHAQLIMSDPREAEGFLVRLEDYSRKYNNALESIWWQYNEESERSDLLKWAYTEADLLLRQHRPVITELTQCLVGGAATIGDCVAIIEEW